MRNQLQMLFRIGAALVLMTAAAAPAMASTAADGANVDVARSQLDAAARGQGSEQVNSQIVSTFSTLAGSEDNAQALASGLRTGGAIELKGTGPDGSTTSTTITPPTKGMGWGNVYITLSLAQASLNQQGITDPSNAQLSDALTAILSQRADGTGWGQIAQNLGVKLGPVVSALRSASGRLRADQGGVSSNAAHPHQSGPSDHPGQTDSHGQPSAAARAANAPEPAGAAQSA